MASETWFGQIESAVYNKFYKLMKSHTNEKVNSANYVSTDVSTSDLTLPTVYFHQTDGQELGKTFDTGINAIRADMQIDVYTESKSDCSLISRVATAKMSELGFEAVQLPIIDSTPDISHGVMRFRIVIGSGNTSTGFII